MKQLTPWKLTLYNPPAPKPAAPAPGARRTIPRLPIGLGDWVWSWAHLMAGWLDRRIAPTLQTYGLWRGGFKLAGCGGCSWRRLLYNALLPDLTCWAAWRAFPGRLWRHLRVGGHLFRAPGKPAALPLQRGGKTISSGGPAGV